jgi:hypothetical protein
LLSANLIVSSLAALALCLFGLVIELCFFSFETGFCFLAFGFNFLECQVHFILFLQRFIEINFEILLLFFYLYLYFENFKV